MTKTIFGRILSMVITLVVTLIVYIPSYLIGGHMFPVKEDFVSAFLFKPILGFCEMFIIGFFTFAILYGLYTLSNEIYQKLFREKSE